MILIPKEMTMIIPRAEEINVATDLITTLNQMMASKRKVIMRRAVELELIGEEAITKAMVQEQEEAEAMVEDIEAIIIEADIKVVGLDNEDKMEITDQKRTNFII